MAHRKKIRRRRVAASPKLDAFTRSYIEAMLFSTNDESDEGGGEPLDRNYSASDIAPETMELIVEDCADFQKRFGQLITDEPEVRGEEKWGRWELAGGDYWFTREGHGSGFWDGDWPKNGDELTKAAKSYGPFELYVEDGVISYGSSPEYYRSHRTNEAQPMMRQDDRDHRMVTLYDDDALELMQGWWSGQDDPLYAIHSMGGQHEAWVFQDAIANLDADIAKVKKLGKDKFQFGKGTFTKKEIDEL